MAKYVGGVPVLVECCEKNGFKLQPEERTRLDAKNPMVDVKLAE